MKIYGFYSQNLKIKLCDSWKKIARRPFLNTIKELHVCGNDICVERKFFVIPSRKKSLTHTFSYVVILKRIFHASLKYILL